MIDTYSVGIKLQGSEVKSIRHGKVSLQEAFCHVTNNEVFIRNMNISQNIYSGKYSNHDPIRERKLLLHRTEINKISKSIKQKGLTLIPLSIIISNTGFIKLEIAIARGKKNHDKRESIKTRELERNSKNYE